MALDNIRDAIGADTFGKSKGNFLVRKQYYYHNMTQDEFKSKVLKVFPNAKIIATGDHFAQFSGGASVAKSSHIWVRFNVTKQELNDARKKYK